MEIVSNHIQWRKFCIELKKIMDTAPLTEIEDLVSRNLHTIDFPDVKSAIEDYIDYEANFLTNKIITSNDNFMNLTDSIRLNDFDKFNARRKYYFSNDEAFMFFALTSIAKKVISGFLYQKGKKL